MIVSCCLTLVIPPRCGNGCFFSAQTKEGAKGQVKPLNNPPKIPPSAEDSLQELVRRGATPLQGDPFPGSITSTLSRIYEFTCNSFSVFRLILSFSHSHTRELAFFSNSSSFSYSKLLIQKPTRSDDSDGVFVSGHGREAGLVVPSN